MSSTVYPALASALGTTYGAYGKLPDLRGEFIRGADLGREIDSERLFGSNQSQNTGVSEHRHYLAANTSAYSDYGTKITTSSYVAAWGGHNSWAEQYILAPTSVAPSVGLSGLPVSTTGGSLGETRPRNVSLLPCIKY